MQGIDLITIKKPKDPVAEAYRTLRTNIQFSSFDEKIQTIVVTSSGPSEGKSTTASNLAVVMAQSGHKTIIIDCDQRKPRLHKVFEVSNKKGLSNILVGESSFEECLNKTQQENLFMLSAGITPPNPAELLASNKMKSFINDLKKDFDYIVLDTPPIIMVTDAQILSQYSDGSILVISSGEAEKEAAIKAKQLLEKVKARVLGVVLNKVNVSAKGYYGYYYHYYYGKDGEKQSQKHKVKK